MPSRDSGNRVQPKTQPQDSGDQRKPPQHIGSESQTPNSKVPKRSTTLGDGLRQKILEPFIKGVSDMTSGSRGVGQFLYYHRGGSDIRLDQAVPAANAELRTRKHVTIAVMGPTGSGKSTFINLISQSRLAVSSNLGSSTQEAETSIDFELDGHTVTLIDTPGFDDTNRSDSKVLQIIVAFLEALYRKGIILHGVLYLHRISDNRLGGTSKRSFDLFQKVCGEGPLKNVVIATTMWNKVAIKEGEAREEELRKNVRFFKPALQNGARLVRHDASVESARSIIKGFLVNKPLPLTIQHELVEKKMHFSDTSAGKEIRKQLEEMVIKFKDSMTATTHEMQEAKKIKDKKTIEELRVERRNIREKVKSVKSEMKRVQASYSRRRRRAVERFRGKRVQVRV